jgi:hypothetical protein
LIATQRGVLGPPRRTNGLAVPGLRSVADYNSNDGRDEAAGEPPRSDLLVRSHDSAVGLDVITPYRAPTVSAGGSIQRQTGLLEVWSR